MIGDAPIKMCQINKKTVLTVHDSCLIKVKNPSKLHNSITAKNFLPDVWKQLFIANDRNGEAFFRSPEVPDCTNL